MPPPYPVLSVTTNEVWSPAKKAWKESSWAGEPGSLTRRRLPMLMMRTAPAWGTSRRREKVVRSHQPVIRRTYGASRASGERLTASHSPNSETCRVNPDSRAMCKASGRWREAGKRDGE